MRQAAIPVSVFPFFSWFRREITSGIVSDLGVISRYRFIALSECCRHSYGSILVDSINPLTPNDSYSGRTTPLTS